MNKNISLVYMVAWMSSRFGWKIKQFAKVGPNWSTLMEYSLDQALKSKFSKIIFIVGKMTEIPFREKFWDNYKWIPVHYAIQTFNEQTRDKPRWTVDALCSAKNLIDWQFIVCNWDDIYWENSFKILFDHLNKSEEMASLWYILKNVLPEKWSTNRGIFQTDSNNYVQNINEIIWIEKDKLSDIGLTKNALCSMNIFWLTKNILNSLNDRLTQFKINKQGDKKAECYLPVEISNIMKTEWIKMKLYSTPDTRLWITNPDDEEVVKKQIEEIESNK
jgi:hypothetical protein